MPFLSDVPWRIARGRSRYAVLPQVRAIREAGAASFGTRGRGLIGALDSLLLPVIHAARSLYEAMSPEHHASRLIASIESVAGRGHVQSVRAPLEAASVQLGARQ